MQSELFWLRESAKFACERNPIWPFAALIVDEQDRCLVSATDAGHISPLFHAEMLAIHYFSLHCREMGAKKLRLFSTAECDTMSQCAVYWANVLEIPIKECHFALSCEFIEKLWPFGIRVPSREIISKSTTHRPKCVGPYDEVEEINELFYAAKKRQELINNPHPGMVALSKNVDDFVKVNFP